MQNGLKKVERIVSGIRVKPYSVRPFQVIQMSAASVANVRPRDNLPG
jgi:hypothetical protein